MSSKAIQLAARKPWGYVVMWIESECVFCSDPLWPIMVWNGRVLTPNSRSTVSSIAGSASMSLTAGTRKCGFRTRPGMPSSYSAGGGVSRPSAIAAS